MTGPHMRGEKDTEIVTQKGKRVQQPEVPQVQVQVSYRVMRNSFAVEREYSCLSSMFST